MKGNGYTRGKAAEFFVAGELSRRGYAVAMPPGNMACTDLLVESPSGNIFGVEIKNLRGPNCWLIKDSPVEDSRYYVLVFLPKDKPVEYFILQPAEMKQEKADYWQKCWERGVRERTTLYECINWLQAKPYKDRWDVLPH